MARHVLPLRMSRLSAFYQQVISDDFQPLMTRRKMKKRGRLIGRA